jgi:SAM-dependent methyltransferase
MARNRQVKKRSSETGFLFSKYEGSGAYHWIQADPAWGNASYSAPLVARYHVLIDNLPQTSHNILEVGCGDGYLLYLLNKRGFNRVVGIDNHPIGIQLAQGQLQRHNHADAYLVSVASAYDLPFSARFFDSVVMADVIEHLDTPEKALREISRVLRQNGVLVLSTPNWQPDRIWDKLHVREFRPEELQKMLAPFFQKVTLFSCWPMWCVRLWERGGRWRRLLNSVARLGFNLFEISTSKVSAEYGQLMAVCWK